MGVSTLLVFVIDVLLMYVQFNFSPIILHRYACNILTRLSARYIPTLRTHQLVVIYRNILLSPYRTCSLVVVLFNLPLLFLPCTNMSVDPLPSVCQELCIFCLFFPRPLSSCQNIVCRSLSFSLLSLLLSLVSYFSSPLPFTNDQNSIIELACLSTKKESEAKRFS